MSSQGAVAVVSVAERVQWIKRWLKWRDVKAAIPKPHALNEEYERWRREKQELFWRPVTSHFPFDVSMRCAGLQGAEIVRASHLEPTTEGYWFVTDVPGSGVYCRSPYPDNFAMGNLMWSDADEWMRRKGMLPASVEEVPLIWGMRKTVAPIPKDNAAIVWLRTRAEKDRAFYLHEEAGTIDSSEDSFYGIAQMTALIVGARGVRRIPNAD